MSPLPPAPHPAPLNHPCRYEILRTCVAELAATGIICDAAGAAPLLPYTEAAPLEEAAAQVAVAAEGQGGCGMEEEGEQAQRQYLRWGAAALAGRGETRGRLLRWHAWLSGSAPQHCMACCPTVP